MIGSDDGDLQRDPPRPAARTGDPVAPRRPIVAHVIDVTDDRVGGEETVVVVGEEATAQLLSLRPGQRGYAEWNLAANAGIMPFAQANRLGYHRRLYNPYLHYTFAAVTWITVVAAAVTIGQVWAFSHNSLVSLVFGDTTGQSPTGSPWPLFAFSLATFGLLLWPKVIRKFAFAEERDYRAGAESWSWKRRTRKTVTFSLVHIWNLVIPFAVVIALIIASVYLMAVYLLAYRASGTTLEATAASTMAHVAFNRMFLLAFGTALVLSAFYV